MTMKHIYLMPLLFVMAACGQDEWPSGAQSEYSTEVITFSSPYEAGTRAAALRDGSFQMGDKVGVLGYCKASNGNVDISDEPWNTKRPFSYPDIFYNQELTYDGTGSWTYNWTGSGSIGGLHPWLDNEDYTYSFFAYYPYASGTPDRAGERDIVINGVNMGTVKLSGENDRSDPTITYTMPHSDGVDLKSGHDWWVVPDLMLAYTIDHRKSDGSVKLDFRHMFCAFQFRVNNYNLYDVTISDLYLSGGTTTSPRQGFYKSLSVVGQESGYSVGDDVYIGRFKLLAGHDEGGFSCPGATIGADGQLIPSSLDIERAEEGHEGEMIVLLFIPDADGKLTSDGNESLRLELQARSEEGGEINGSVNMLLKDASFKPGMRSVFNINIVGNDFIIQVESEDAWEDGGDSNIVFE